MRRTPTMATMTRYELRILGAPDLRAPDGGRVTSVLAQPSRLALLAYLTLAPGPVTRAAVVAAFWPESDEARARNSLSQAVFYLRRSLGKDSVQGVEGDRLWVPPEEVWCDARVLLTDGQPPPEVLAAAAHDLLAGWNADVSQPLQEWLDAQRRIVRDRRAELVPAHVPPQRALAEAGRSAPSTLVRSRWLSAVGAAGLAALLLIALLPSVRPTQGPPTRYGVAASATPSRLAVLLPRVTRSPGAPDLAALTLNAEVIAQLPERADIDLVSASYATSLQDFTRQLETIIGPGEDMPEWILEVSVTVAGDSVHVVGLLYEGASFDVDGLVSFDLELGSPAETVIDVPREIAERVAAMVGEGIQRED